LRPSLKWFLLTVSCGLLLSLACGSGAEETPGGTPTPVPTPIDFAAIRDLDFASMPEADALLQRLGSGRVDVDGVLFRDLTGDLREEAIVPITSDGTLGNVAYLVFTLKAGKPEVILTRTMDRTTASGLVMSIDDFGALIEKVGVYGNEDPLCCPGELRLTTFRWDGSELQVAGEQKQDNPDKAKQ
jgi:hypothetical protein